MKVILVGPAPYINEKKMGRLIDKFDLVCRCNKGIYMTNEPEHFGTRTDILFHCVSQKDDNGGIINEEIIKKYEIGNIYFVYPKLEPLESITFKEKGNLKIYQELDEKVLNEAKIYPKDKYLKLENEMGTRPNTGILALEILLNSNLEYLYLTGFSFFKGGFIPSYRSSFLGKKDNLEKVVMKYFRKNNTHDQDKIKLYFVKNYLHHPKLYIDFYLLDLLLDDPQCAPFVKIEEVKIFGNSCLKSY